MNRHKIDHKAHLNHIIQDLIANDCVITDFVGDNPKRANAKAVLNHSSLFPCEYCFQRGVAYAMKNKDANKAKELQLRLVIEKINKLQEQPSTSKGNKELDTLQSLRTDIKKALKSRRSKIVWPACTRNGECRTEAKIRRIVEKIEADPNLPASEKKGVVGRSPLLDLENFDYVNDVSVDYMHAICIGVVKKMVELTFDVGDNRDRITRRKLSSASAFNKLMLQTKVVGEFSRRARSLDFAVMKAAEFRNLLLFFFPHVLDCIPQGEMERSIWLFLVYMVRSCILPQEEFNAILLSSIKYSSQRFYILYEKTFGPNNCSYNTHVSGSHILKMRSKGPLTATSAFQFESFYGEMRNAFTPGTQSPLKQIFEQILLKRSVLYHCCAKSMIFSDHDTSLECNTLVYVYKDSKYHFYCIVQIEEENLICNEIETIPCHFNETPDKLNWSKVGVFLEGNTGTDFEVIKKENVCGKLLRVGEYLITCPINILRET